MQSSKGLKWIVGGVVILAFAVTINLSAGLWARFPVWQFIRFSGLLSYLFLCLGISLGIAYSMPVWTAEQKLRIYKYHSSATISGAFCGLMHAMFLLIDTYMSFSLIELLIPFTAPVKPVLFGLGTISLYGVLLIIFTTDVRSKLFRKLWMTIHMCAYPIYLTALAHGMLGGTDTKNPWIFMMYVVSFVIVLLLMVIQAILVKRSRNKAVVNKKQLVS